jgi:hypothetical protein
MDLPPSLAVVPPIPAYKQTLEQLKAERDHWQRRLNELEKSGADRSYALEASLEHIDRWFMRRTIEQQKQKAETMKQVMSKLTSLRLEYGYWYLASPYSKWTTGLDDACKHIAEFAGRLLEKGIFVYSPIAHSHTIARAAMINPMDHDIWLPADKPLFLGAYGLLVAKFDGWDESFGIGQEIKWAIEHERPIKLIDPDSFELESTPNLAGRFS